MRNSEAENNDPIEENYIGTSNYAIDVSNINTDLDHDLVDNQYVEESEDFENSNTNMEMLSASKIKHEEVDMDYDNYYEAYSSDINDEKEDLKTDIKDEKIFENMEMGLQSQKVKVELEEPDDENGDQSNNISNNDDKRDEKIKMKPASLESHGIEIKIDKNEVIKDRFGQVATIMVKCDSCDKVYLGKVAKKKSCPTLERRSPNTKK